VTGAATGAVAGTCIQLDPDVAAIFRDAAAVNQALRSLMVATPSKQ
jgi:hypothetical protein